MRRVSIRVGAVVLLLAMLCVPILRADDAPPGTEPPQVRIGPPIGATSPDEESEVRIGPPIGAPSEDDGEVRIGPPGGVSSTEEPLTLFEMLRVWMQARIGLR